MLLVGADAALVQTGWGVGFPLSFIAALGLILFALAIQRIFALDLMAISTSSP